VSGSLCRASFPAADSSPDLDRAAAASLSRSRRDRRARRAARGPACTSAAAISLRHSFASFATDLELLATTLARLAGHADAGFTLKVYARDRREDGVVVEDVLARAKRAKVGGLSAF
jgi:integrase